jgi:ribosomal protein S18 acetylase RimI-like enzyme
MSSLTVEQIEAILAEQNARNKGSGTILSLAITKEDQKDAVAVLCKAFKDYPINMWIMEGRPEEEIDEMTRFGVRYVNRTCRTSGHVLVLREEATGKVLGAMQYEERHQSTNVIMRGLENLRAGVIQASSMFFGSTGFPSFMFKSYKTMKRCKCSEVFEAEHEKVIPSQQHHFHLYMIGTDPDQQAKGLGRQMVEAMAALADALHVPVYMETNTLRLKGFYERMGYESKVHYTLPDDEKPYTENYGMLRLPSPVQQN